MNFHQSYKSVAFPLQTSQNYLKPPQNQFKRQIKLQQNMATRGSYVHNSIGIFLGPSQKCFLMQFSQNIDGLRQIESQGF